MLNSKQQHQQKVQRVNVIARHCPGLRTGSHEGLTGAKQITRVSPSCPQWSPLVPLDGHPVATSSYKPLGNHKTSWRLTVSEEHKNQGNSTGKTADLVLCHCKQVLKVLANIYLFII